MVADATKAELEALRWLIAHGQGLNRRSSITGGTFVAYYEEKTGRGYTTDRGHAWRRTGGRVLARMARKGLVVCCGTTRGTAEYVIGVVGREAAEA